MNSKMIFSICSLFYGVLILVVYFSKQRLKNAENKIYSLLLVSNVIGLSIEILCAILYSFVPGFEILKLITLRLINIYFFH